MPRFDGKNDSTHRWKESRGYSWRKAQQIQIWREISMIIRSKNWKCLSLILHSEDDAVASFEKVEKVKHRFPNLTLVYIPPMAGPHDDGTRRRNWPSAQRFFWIWISNIFSKWGSLGAMSASFVRGLNDDFIFVLMVHRFFFTRQNRMNRVKEIKTKNSQQTINDDDKRRENSHYAKIILRVCQRFPIL